MKEQWPPTTAEACNKVYDQLMPLIVYSLATECGLSINAGGAHAAAEVERQGSCFQKEARVFTRHQPPSPANSI